jgi:hypothetical protein
MSWVRDAGNEEALSSFVVFDIQSLTIGPAGRTLVSVDSEARIGVFGVDPSLPAVEPECLGTCEGGG